MHENFVGAVVGADKDDDGKKKTECALAETNSSRKQHTVRFPVGKNARRLGAHFQFRVDTGPPWGLSVFLCAE